MLILKSGNTKNSRVQLSYEGTLESEFIQAGTQPGLACAFADQHSM